MARLGADVQDLDRLATKFDDFANRLDAAAFRIDAQVKAAWWRGDIASRFEESWRRADFRHLSDISQRMRVVAGTVRSQSQQQRDASSVGGGTLGVLDGQGEWPNRHPKSRPFWKVPGAPFRPWVPNGPLFPGQLIPGITTPYLPFTPSPSDDGGGGNVLRLVLDGADSTYSGITAMIPIGQGLLNFGNEPALDWLSTELFDGGTQVLGKYEDAFGAIGDGLGLIQGGIHGFELGQALATDAWSEATLRSAIDVAFDVAGTALPVVGLGKAAWDTGWMIGDGIHSVVGDSMESYHQDGVLNRLYGTDDLTVQQATEYSHRYDGIKGFGNFVSDGTKNIVNSGWSAVKSLF